MLEMVLRLKFVSIKYKEIKSMYTRIAYVYIYKLFISGFKFLYWKLAWNNETVEVGTDKTIAENISFIFLTVVFKGHQVTAHIFPISKWR